MQTRQTLFFDLYDFLHEENEEEEEEEEEGKVLRLLYRDWEI